MFLARAYLDGIGVERDVNAAADVVRLPCDDEGRPGACVVQARARIELRVRVDEALIVLKELCDERNIRACVALGVALRDGAGSKNAEAAAKAFRVACEENYEPGCEGLDSLGVPRPEGK